MIKNQKRKYRKNITFLICLLFIFSPMVMLCTNYAGADGLNPQIWTTDENGIHKDDFLPESIVYINGEGFNSNTQVTIEVTRPDGEVDSGTILTNSNGEFVFEYDLNGIEGNYTVYATDSINDATCTFTDLFAALTYKDSNYNNRISAFYQGDTIYAKITAGCKSRFIWKNHADEIVHKHPSSGWLTGGGPYYDSYTLPTDAEIGTWTITREYECCSFLGCYDSSETRKFYVVPNSKIIPTEDAHVNNLGESTFVNVNFENSEKLHTKFKDIYILFVGWQLDQKRSYLKFDLPDFTPSTQVISATLHMYRSCGGDSGIVDVFDIPTDPWTEKTVTWNNKPSNLNLLDSIDIVSGDSWYEWDVTDAVLNEYSSGDKELNLEVRLDRDEVDKHQDFFSSEENDQSVYRGPHIEISTESVSQTVGGLFVPVDKTAVLAPYIHMAVMILAMIGVLAAAVVYYKRR